MKDKKDDNSTVVSEDILLHFARWEKYLDELESAVNNAKKNRYRVKYRYKNKVP